MAEFDKVLDNGDRQEFETGSKRDTAEGKGTPHLIAGETMIEVSKSLDRSMKNVLLSEIQNHLFGYCSPKENKAEDIGQIEIAARLALRFLAEQEGNLFYHTMVRFSKHYENGAKKYGNNNWRKGQPISRYYGSAMRHLWKLMDNDIEEDHASALLWNLTCILQTKMDIKRGYLPETIDDFPFTKSDLFGKAVK